MSAQVVTDWQIGWGVVGGYPVALALGLALLVVAVLGSRMREPVGARRVVLIALRWLSAVAAFVLASQPTFWAERTRSEEGQVAVVLDVSRSMGIRTGDEARSARLRELVKRWLKSARAASARFYLVGSELVPVERTVLESRLDANAAATRLWSSVRELTERENLGAVIVVSDGADTSGAPLPKQFDTRVHTVFVGDQRPLRDDAIAELEADKVAFLHGKGKVHATLTTTGFGRRELAVTLERAGRTLAARRVIVDEGESRAIELDFEPLDLGREVYTLRVAGDADDDVPENNERSFLVRVARDRMRVLHVSGRPSWDQRFLRGFLKRDPSIDLVSFFILRSVHDMTMSDPSELALIPFPTDELFRQHLTSFDLILLQDFDYGPYQMAPYLPLIRDYVREGGGLAMIGGSLSFDGGGYGETALAEVLPARMRASDPTGAQIIEGAFVPEVVASLVHHPLLELYPDAAQTLAAFRALEPLVGANALLGVREGGIALLEHPKAKTPKGERAPVLSVGSYGKGRVLAFASDTSWHWSMPTAGKGADPSAYDRFWDRSIRWLTRDPLLEPSSLASAAESYGPNARIAVSGLARDASYRLLRHTDLSISVIDREGQKLSQQATRSDDAGRVELTVEGPRDPGVYALVLSRADSELARTPFLVELSGIELARPAPRREPLQQVARSSQGRFVDVDDAPDLQEFDATRSTALGIERHAPFGMPLWAALLFALLGVEWTLRRRWGAS